MKSSAVYLKAARLVQYRSNIRYAGWAIRVAYSGQPEITANKPREYWGQMFESDEDDCDDLDRNESILGLCLMSAISASEGD